jgi:hypothetical protein
MEVPLRIMYHDLPCRDATAWLIPGAGPETWLSRLCWCRIASDNLKLFVVPQSAKDLSPLGLLIVQCGAGSQGAKTPGHAYARLADKLYVPAEAQLDPDLSEPEIAALLQGDKKIYLFHPAAGWIAFEPGEALDLCALLSPPDELTRDWSLARSGIPADPRLASVQPEIDITLETVMEEIDRQIDTESADLGELPPSPEEPASGILSGLTRTLQKWTAKAVQKLTQKQPKQSPSGKAAQKTTAQGGRLAQWAARKLQQLDRAVVAMRHRSVLRLLHMLATNPDEGLRYAIPFEEARNRGRATPSGNLAAHEVDFNLAHFGGGRPADHWRIKPEFSARLHVKYLELAARETRLGRHRRAAYIYAKLLGMFDQAAGALVAGRHWREAAALYRHRLNRPDQAATCLEQGGLWSEAIALYGELGEYEKAGDLCKKLQQSDEAAKFYRQAVSECLQSGEICTAARLLEVKLAAPDEALEHLATAWPDSSEAAPCLREYFSLVGRLGRHDSAEQKVAALRLQTSNVQEAAVLGSILSEMAGAYPHASVREIAVDAVYLLAAVWLPKAVDNARRGLVGAIGRVAPGDRLLQRDCDRYLNPPIPRLKPAAKSSLQPAVPLSPRMKGSPILIHKQRLPFDVQWQAAVVLENCYCIAGFKAKQLILVQVPQSGKDVGPMIRSWTLHSPAPGPVLMAAMPGAASVELCLLLANHPPLRYRKLHPLGASNKSARAGTPRWVTEQTVGIQRSSDGCIHLLSNKGHALLWHVLGPDGSPLRTQRVTAMPRDSITPEPLAKPPFAVRDDQAFVALKETLLQLHPSGRSEKYELPHPARSLAVSNWYSVSRVIACLEKGAVLYWCSGSGKSQFFGQDLAEPVGIFTLSGWIVLADEHQCQAFRSQGDRLHCMLSMPGEGSAPISILPAGQPDQFALLTADGWLRTYQLPRME